ncbi:MAG: amidohydrolase family protein [Saccharofermentanales bacterium]
MDNLLIKNANIVDGESKKDILIKDGIIKKIGNQLKNEGEYSEIDAAGRVVLPTLIEGHIHPDKAFLEERMPNQSGTLEEALKNTAELKSKYTYDDVYERSERVLRRCIRNGVTIMRAQPDVDPFEKTLGVKVLLDLREKYKDVLDMEIVAFPQEGFIRHPEVYDMLIESIEMGADVIGGCPYGEDTMEQTVEQLKKVFDIAEKYNLPVDMHADFGTNVDDPQNNVIELICDLTIERGYQGRVALGHVTTLGSLDPEVAAPIFDKIAEAGITIIPLPATDLFMTGGDHEKNKPRGMAPVKRMLKHGVNVVTSTNNIRNAFTPFNDANLLTIGYLLQVTQQMGSAAERKAVVDMITYNTAKCLGITDSYGLQEGKNADIVIFDSYDISNLFNDRPLLTHVIKRGKVIVKNTLTSEVEAILLEE